MASSPDPLEPVRGFMKSRILLTAAELDVFTALHDGPLSAEQLAEKTGTDLRALSRLLDCLVTFGHLAKEDGAYRLTEEGAVFSARHPESVLPMVLHMNHVWDNWHHLTRTVQEGTNAQRKAPTASGPESLKAFIGAMHVVGRNLAREIARSLDLSPYRSLLDIGGGSGTYTIAFLEENPSMRAVLFDLPDVIPMAQERLAQARLLDRVTLVAGDFYNDELPSGCDLALLSAIIHQNSREENRTLFQKIQRALQPEGGLLIRDHIMDSDRTWPAAGALFAINMLANTAGGDTYTFEEVAEDLKWAGFRHVQWIRKGARMDSLVLATS
ncbi:Dimerisation domain-containing protein [Desulfacinum hydrothermale DSM 13146]|uniref:Dimerisation domain-containing protein n=1 Tax=Desulfacinum hydrothermale DSM 13146 TaxID=1121390 RepID=A0A1W1X2Q9_9BACT|nr:methyltransferase [Desulfacinum hydrothermale]SMC18050.1 Dimerisation domain-containing protein [Desulfacinum hydrothermale DSM 13146]